MIRRPPRSPLFPSTTLFRSLRRDSGPDRPGGDRRLIRFIRESGLYPSCDRGHVNLYQPFLERALVLARNGGRVGLVLPWGDRKSTRLNSSHLVISYAVFCLK